MQSEFGQFNLVDAKAWVRNVLTFLAPLVLLYLAQVMPALDTGFSWSAFHLTPLTQGALALYILNAVTDFFKKLLTSPV